MAQDNRSWGYDRLVGALANLGYTVSAQTVGNILKRHGLPPAPERKRTTTWKEFIRLCRKVGFWRQNPKVGSRKINYLRISTFLFSVICDRVL
jgi:hypothetical protein